MQNIILRQPDHHKPGKLLRLIELYFAAAHHNAVGLAAGIVGGIVNAGIDAADRAAVLDQRIQRHAFFPPGINRGNAEAGGVFEQNHGAEEGSPADFFHSNVGLWRLLTLHGIVRAYTDGDQRRIHGIVKLGKCIGSNKRPDLILRNKERC